ncbi:uncharacterized protein N7484_000728 [Penicillium longicatenatum]|uniref:uncharacterized protein n=1 Tax=Penicillium longicatenatum TaxID=1561947 RepID=UPI0025481436|nr:uncharacterized protein N7484_000728 [Penicillium longicatenatum]KAJ5661356.1 hypothetical protein N7484_000728 [Penicillium longicatenatum]KAJ5667004.1 hypothetical protein N7507_002868 [Penicillium longicatenatum]
MLNTTTQSGDTLHTTLKSAPMMKSVRFHGSGDIRVDEIEEPMCSKGQVKVCIMVQDEASLRRNLRKWWIHLTAIDLHEYTSGPVLIPQTPHRITGSTYPISMGHEFGGIIEEVGDGVTHLSPGQRAVVRPTIFDGTCSACKQGHKNCCENIGFIGLSGYGGGMSKKIVAPAGHFYSIPETISLEAAALIEPLAVAWHAVNLSPFNPGDNVLLVGGGPIGVGVVQVLKLQGARNIMVSELMESRQQLCRTYGATHILDPRKGDVAQGVREITSGVGADVIFDAAGVEKALIGAIPACKAQGTIVNIAVWEKSPSIPVNHLMYKELRYMGAALYDETSFLDTIRAVNDGLLKPEGMISSRIRLDEVVEKGFKALLEHRDEHCKILVDVQA